MPMMLSTLICPLLAAGMLVVGLGGCNLGGCNGEKACDKAKKATWCAEGPTPYPTVACGPPKYTNLRAELDYRLWLQWSRITALHDVDPGPAPPKPQRPELESISTNELVEELQLEEGRNQELVQPCDAPTAIRRHIGGVAMLIDKGNFQMPPEGVTVVELPSQPMKHSGSNEDICPSETAADALQLDTTNGGTLFFLDRHHLVGAGHLADDCNDTTARLKRYIIVFGLTHQALTSHGTIEVPVEQVIDGSTVTVVECHNNLQSEGDWMVLRTDACICGAEPLPVRWDPVRKGEIVHTLGHPNNLTMKYAQPSKIGDVDDSAPPRVPIFRMDLVTDGGNSGGPVFDDGGNVVGINNGNYKDSCTTKCTAEAGTCCRLAPCKFKDCLLDGYATHVQRVEAAWRHSREQVSWKECKEE